MTSKLNKVIVAIFAIVSLAACNKESEGTTDPMTGLWYLAEHTSDDDLTEADKEPGSVKITPSSPDPNQGLTIMELLPIVQDVYYASFYQIPPSYFNDNKGNYLDDYKNYFVSKSELSLKSMTVDYASDTWKIESISSDKKEIKLSSKVLVSDTEDIKLDYFIIFKKL
jgi:hypothetical protein